LEFSGHLQSGNHRFLIHSTTAARKQGLPLLAALDSRYLAFLGCTVAAAMGLMLLLNTHFQEEKTLYGDTFAGIPRLHDYSYSAMEEPRPRFAFASGFVAGRTGGKGQAMAGASGVMGSKKSLRATGRFSMKKHKEVPQLARGRTMEQAREAGILGVLKQEKSFASLTAVASFSSGHDAVDVFGGLIGNEVGEMAGGWGHGFVGVGKGGGGTEFGTIGAGHYGVIGHGTGTGSGWGGGAGGGLRGHEGLIPGVRIGNADAIGDLDKNIIRRYIRRQLPRIKYCYESALIADQDLEGSIETTFQITPQGVVKSVGVTGMDEEETLQKCVGETLESIQFPKPKGGGYVSVRYPFTFAATQ
jgi:hypothetical protein